MELENAKILNAKGELSDENNASYEKLRRSFDQLLHCVSSLAEALDMQPPVMLEDDIQQGLLQALNQPLPRKNPLQDSICGMMKRPRLSMHLYLISEHLCLLYYWEKLNQSWQSSMESLLILFHQECTMQSETEVQEHQTDEKANEERKNRVNTVKERVDKETSEEVIGRKEDTVREKIRGIDGANLDSLLQKLPRCGSRDLVDQLAVEFCYLNSKANRKKLVRALFSVPRTSLELLPYYSRLVATLSPYEESSKGKYSQVHLIALLTAGLSCYHHDFAVTVVDEVLEEIRVGLELNDYAMQQQRLAHMRFLGELYNYEYIDSSVIFETLNLLIIFGHRTPEQDLLDPPEDCFRIRLIITLLQTCGHYFSRGSSKRKLDRFLLFFQRYALRKGPLPLDVEFDVQDMFAELRPNMTRHSSIEGLNDALVALEENDRVTTAEKGGDERHADSESQLKQSENAAFDANGKRAENRTKKNVKGHEEVADSESSSDSRSRYRNGHEDGKRFPYEERLDDRLENEDNSECIDAPVGSDEEETVEVRRKVVRVDPKEQEDFDKELKAILQESLESRKLELARPIVNMTIPMNV
ncbi:Regulator of nonsense transcripts UPF2 [Dichanthelium oligosanthes]|uniref:Regulator of nonsense transcripts UPF2 n=1 Tax=Dichanthelium oligosanthes TaxID=888268 RepID=A0A1E5VWK6_9POAL|nr:Regulator of nonsense transcripts UPF2 [Dichanthelium oligosanthes]